MSEIEQRAKRIVASKVTDLVVDMVSGDDRDRLEDAKRREKQARMEAMARAAARDNDRTQPPATGEGTDSSAIDEMMADEECPVCSKILQSVKTMREPRRTRGVAAYGEFRRAIEESEEAAVEVLDSNPVLKDALDDVREANL